MGKEVTRKIKIEVQRISANLVKLPILRYLFFKGRENFTIFTYFLMTDSYECCKKYCKQYEIDTPG